MNHAADYSYAEIANKDPAFAQVSGLHWLKLEYEYKPVVYDFGSTFTENAITHTDACGWIAVSGAIKMMVELDKSFCKRENVVHQARDENLRKMFDRRSTTPQVLKSFTGNPATNCRITDAEFEHLAIILGIKIAVFELQGTDQGPDLYINRSFGFQHFASRISIFQNGYSHFVVMFDDRIDVGPEFQELIVDYTDIPDILRNESNFDSGNFDSEASDCDDLDKESIARIHSEIRENLFEMDDVINEWNKSREAIRDVYEARQSHVDANIAMILQLREEEDAANAAKQYEDDARYAVELAEEERSGVRLERVASAARSRFNPNAKPWTAPSRTN